MKISVFVDTETNLYIMSFITTLFLLFSFTFSLSTRDILVHFYESTNGYDWKQNTNWNTSSSFCSWYGILCNSNQEVYRISLMSNNLVGTLPSDLFNIVSLQRLYLDSNKLYGTIEPEWFTNSYLTRFSLMENYFTGIIPSAIGNLTYVALLDLSHNQFLGTIPNEITTLANLMYLDLSNNKLDGTIPSEINKIQYLYYFYLSNNRLSGTIPESLWSMTNLYELFLDLNEFTGSLPTQITGMSSLYSLILNSNRLSGTIPESFSNLTSIYYLYFTINSLSGTIPECIYSLPNIAYMHIGQNEITGTISPSIGKMTRLKELKLSNNKMYGELPYSLFSLSQLTYLYLEKNQFTGTISNSIGNLTQLKEIWLSFNLFEGTIPESLYNIPNLMMIYIHNNQFSGSISDSICRLSSITTLSISNNPFLSGTIPNCIGSLTRLERLFITKIPHITGTIPDSIGNLTSLTVLNFPENIQGTLPSSFSSLIQLTSFSLTNSKITGTIPNIFGNMTKLKSLYLNSNQFYGSIPSSIQSLISLEDLDLSDNHLNGTFDFSILIRPRLTYFDISENVLTDVSDCHLQDPQVNPWNYKTEPLSSVESFLAKKTFLGLSSSQSFRFFQCLRSYASNASFIDISYNQMMYHLTNSDFEGAYYADDTKKYNYVSYNCFLKLNIFRLSHNNFTGDFSSVFKTFSYTISLDVSFNQFEGSILFTPQFLNVLENPKLKGPINSFISIDPVQVLTVPELELICPNLVFSRLTSILTISPQYTDFSHCYCNQYHVWNGSQCIAYKSNGISCTRSVSSIDCIVHKGWFLLSSNETIKCLKPYHCNPLLESDYLQQDNSQLSLIQSYNSEIQLIAKQTFQCAPGHSGTLCSQCLPGWYSSFGDCYQCSTNNLVGAIFICILIFILFNGYVYKQTKNTLSISEPDNSAKGSISVLIFFFQLTVLSKQIVSQTTPAINETAFTSVISQIVYIASNFNPQGFECILHYSYEQVHYIIIFLPLVIIAWAFLLFLFSKKYSTEDQTTLTTHYTYAILLSFTLLFMNISKAIFEVWNCTTEYGISFLAMKPYVNCLTSQYQTMFSLSIVWFIVFVIGFPSLIGWLNYHQNVKMNSITTKESFWYYETFLLLRKVLITFIGMVFHNTTTKIITMIWILAIYLFIHLSLKPYKHWFNNALEAVVLLHVILYLTTSIVNNSSIYSFATTDSSGFLVLLDITSILIVLSVFVFKMGSKYTNSHKHNPSDISLSSEVISYDDSISIRIHY